VEFSFLYLNDEGYTMTSLAQRVRDFRYSKGWGPDELANRAEISRTALYQIESGKTGLPRAGTLRRIAVALNVSMDDLLGQADSMSHGSIRSSGEHSYMPRAREIADWMPAEGGPLALPAHTHTSSTAHHSGKDDEKGEEPRFMVESSRRSHSTEGLVIREGELMSKLHDLLHSPLGSGLARIIDDLHTLVPRNRNLG
jgi:transcriptional regulator with XRE-family HTH domain